MRPVAVPVATPVVGMTVGCLAVWALVGFVPGGPDARDVGLGMAGPLVAAAGGWVLIARTLAVSPDQLSGRLMAGMGVKFVFFGAYVVLAVRGWSAHTAPFAASFAAFFIGLHVVEAIFLRRALARLASGS